jgi:hypothetical protein
MMLIAFLALLGVDLIVIVVFVAVVLTRRRWVNHQPGAFSGAIKVSSGEIDGLSPKWRRGYGRWVRDVLIWTKGPVLFRNEVVAVDGLDNQRPARSGEVKRLGDQPTVIRVRTGEAVAEIAAHGDDRDRLLGPYRFPDGTTATATPAPTGRAAADQATGMTPQPGGVQQRCTATESTVGVSADPQRDG